MARERETIWNAEANRWNIGKLIVGVLCAIYLVRMMLALMVVAGAANVPNAHPGIQAYPLHVALSSAFVAALCGLAFGWLERRRRRAVGS